MLRVEASELCALDQRVHCRGPAAAGIGASEQVILAANRDTAQARSAGLLLRASRPPSKQRRSAVQRARR
jgi:hypothetical protein